MTDLKACREAFEKWHNESYGTIGVRSLEMYPEETGLGYVEEAVAAQFYLFQHFWNTRANDNGGEAVAWLIDFPDIPSMKPFASDTPATTSGYRNRPLYTHPPRATAVEVVTGIDYERGDDMSCEVRGHKNPDGTMTIDSVIFNKRNKSTEDFKFNMECQCQICFGVRTGGEALGACHWMYDHVPPKERGDD